MEVDFSQVSSFRQADIPHIRFLADIARYVNLDELRSIFVEENLLETEDLAADLGKAFNDPWHSKKNDRKEYLKRMFADPKWRDSFQRCIQKSVDCGDSHNLGHEYILSLLDDTQPKFADDTSIAISRMLQERMKGMTRMMELSMNPSELYQLMVQKNLLTLDELAEFRKNDHPDNAKANNRKILALLEIKGPTAHLLFTQCLFLTRKSSPANGKLFEGIILCLTVNSLAFLCQPLSPFQVPDYLKGETYNERRSRFETYYHNGNWQGLYDESKTCTSSDCPETVAIGYLELALGWIFQLNEVEVRKNLELAGRMITVKVKNPAVLYARHEYLYALLLRYLKQYREASERAETAMMILTLFEVGEDKAFAQYCYATSFVETLAPNCTEEDFQKAKKMLIAAIDYAKTANDMEILVIYSQLQLVRLYLGTTDEYLHVTSDPDRIEKASQCLEELDNKLRQQKLNMRFESLYYLRKSDYHRSKGETFLAGEAAKRAEDVAESANLPIEKQAAKTHITYIEQCGSLVDDSKPVTGQKHVLSVESSPSGSDLPPVKKNRL